MTIAKWCVLIACFLPAVTAMLPKISSLLLSSKGGKYDNNNPREWELQLTGWQKRAIAAHSNGYEALPLFIAAVVFAQIAQGDQGRIDMLAMIFVALRVMYIAVYLINFGTLRSLIWAAAVATNIGLFLM